MDMFKKLKSVFVVEDGKSSPSEESTQVQESRPSEVSNNVATPSVTKSTIQVPSDVKLGESPDQKFVDILLKAIDDNNLQGFDYLEFKSSLQALGKMNMDVATKYQSAMAMAKATGVSPDKILSSAKHYLEILKTENDKFSQAVTAQKAKLTQDQNSGLKNLKDSIASKKAQIEKLNQEIVAETQNLQKMETEIQSGAQKIAETSAKFDQAYQVVCTQITDDIKNISNYASGV
jgi:hypothetical protein